MEVNMSSFWTKLIHRWNIYSPSQRFAILTFAVFVLVLPFTAVMVQKDTENRSRAALREIPITSPVTKPWPDIVCTDTDGGKNYYQKGTVTVMGRGRRRIGPPERIESLQTPSERDTFREDEPSYAKIQTDKCGELVNLLTEYYCDNGQIASENYNCSSGCDDGACIGPSITLTTTPSPTPTLQVPAFKLKLNNPDQVIKVGDVFDVNVLINTAGQKALAGDVFISFDSSKIKIDPYNVRNGNYFDVFLSNHPQDRITSLRQDNKLLMSAWQSSDLNPKSTTNDALFATMTTKAAAEGSTTITFDCTLGTTDSNIFNTDLKDILSCPLQPLTLNIIGSSPTSILTPIPVTAVIQPTPTLAIYPQSYPTPTPFAPTPTPIIFPTAIIPPTYPTSYLQVTLPPTVSPTPLENVIFTRPIPTPTPRPAGGFIINLLRNILILIFGGR